MAVNKSYPAMDIFRIAAALFVVANHTSADVFFTYSIGRLAVPFFFISSGFFLFRPGSTPAEQLAGLTRFTKRIGGLYLVSVVLYLPLNLYMGTFTGLTLAGALADLLWNGTMYHLWYFPATLIGVWVAWALWRAPRRLGIALAAALYLVGLLGDRYFFLNPGIAEALTGIFGFTRNAFFFAGPFVFMGLCMRTACMRIKTPLRAGLLVLSLALLLAEAWFNLSSLPEDYIWYSLFILLPLCSWLLFTLLLQKRGKGYPLLRQVSLWVYILHPWFIAVLNAAIKVVRLPGLSSPHGPVFFVLVSAFSFGAALCFAWVQNRFTASGGPPRAKALVDLAAIRHNLAEMQALLPQGCEVMAVVKADAYGHGAVPVARTLYRQGVRRFAVATLAEGVQLRRHGLRGEILVLGYTPPGQAPRLKLYGLTQTAADAGHANALAAQRLNLRVQLNIDTGMHRLGIPWQDAQDIAAIYALPGLRVTGIYSHLATADSLAPEDVEMVHTQTRRFEEAVAQLKARGIQPGRVHLHSSYGALHYSCQGYDCVRLGLALYGACGPLAGSPGKMPRLVPAMQVTASVASLREVPAGDTVGYSRAYTCTRGMRIATLTIGYADGYPRALEKGYAVINGTKAPITGRISMDQLMVDATHIHGVQQGDTALLLGGLDGDCIDPQEAALCAGSIPNELLSRIGRRVPRVYTG